MAKKYDVLGLGNSIVDILSRVDEEFLSENNINKGIMTLVDENMAEDVYGKMPNTAESSGGSAANTVAGIASLGGTPAFIGRVRNDSLGESFAKDLNSNGVKFDTAPATEGKKTARCMILVTPDAERSMLTFLGACTQLDESDIDEELIKQSQVIYIEGYLWDEPNAISAIKKAIKIAQENDVKVAFTLSDPFCVGRHKKAFAELLSDIDILFANEEEAKMLFGDATPSGCKIIAATKGAEGAVIYVNGEATEVPTTPAANLVDTTGAGDLFAAGFLFGFTQGKDLAECAKLGNAAAGEIVQQLGARPQSSLKKLAA